MRQLSIYSNFLFQGIRLISGLIDEYGLDVVQAYMAHIQVGYLFKFCLRVLAMAEGFKENSGNLFWPTNSRRETCLVLAWAFGVGEVGGHKLCNVFLSGIALFCNCTDQQKISLQSKEFLLFSLPEPMTLGDCRG